jgi:hypothetical protein
MGTMNLLKANWYGKVGETVGAKWKDKSVIRTYAKPAYSDTPAQHVIRTGFGQMTKFLSLFTAQLKGLSALDIRGQSIRNALIQLNKEQVTAGALEPSTLRLSRGGLPLSPVSWTRASQASKVSASWQVNQSPQISVKAKVVIIWVRKDQELALTSTALYSAGSGAIEDCAGAGTGDHCYAYLLDYRGSSKVASVSQYFALA